MDHIDKKLFFSPTQATRTDAEGMLQVLSGLEKQIVDYTTREADYERRMKESREGR